MIAAAANQVDQRKASPRFRADGTDLLDGTGEAMGLLLFLPVNNTLPARSQSQIRKHYPDRM